MAEMGVANPEIQVLRKELDWLLEKEVNPVLQDIRETLQGCYDYLPFHGTAEKSCYQADSQPQRIVMSSSNCSSLNLKSVVTLKGDYVETAEIHFKHKQGKENSVFKTKVRQGSFWKLSQIRDAGSHLCNALEVVSRHDSTHQYSSVREVFLLLDELMDSLLKCRQCLSLPKRKSVQDLVENTNLQIFQPPLPNDIAVSFYIHTSKLVLALYCLHHGGQRQVDVTHRVQVIDIKSVCHDVEGVVRWLNEAAVFFTHSLQQCQHLKDKLLAVSQILEQP